MKTQLIIWLLLLLLHVHVRADNFISVRDGKWDNIAIWRQSGAVASRAPQAGDDVVLMNSIQVTVNSAAATVTYGADWIGMDIHAGAALTVTGAISIPVPRTGCGLYILAATSSVAADSIGIVHASLVNNGTLTVGDGGIVSTGSSFGNYGSLTSSGPLVIDGGSFVNESIMATGNFTLTGFIPFQNVNNGTIDAQKVTISNTGLPLNNEWATIHAHGGIDVSASTLNPCMGQGTITYWGTLDNSGKCKVIATNAPLVELTDFTAKQVAGDVELRWHTASEHNCAYYNIEHSSDGFHFGTIGEQIATGKPTMEQSYLFVHNQPEVGMNYYRLLQVDNQGVSEVTNVAEILVMGIPEDLKSVVVRRGAAFNIDAVDAPGEVFFTDVQGGRYPVTIEDHTIVVDTKDLRAGAYYLSFIQGSMVRNITIIVIE